MYANLHLIVAMSKNKVIGTKNNTLPWHIPKDLKNFKKITKYHTIIMGRKTLESLPNGPLPNRKHIVLTNQPQDNYMDDPVIFVNEAELFTFLETCDPKEQLYVIGGGKVYELLYPYCNKKYITHIYQEIEGSVEFPYTLEEIINKHNHTFMYRSGIQEHGSIIYEFFELSSSTWALRWANKSPISFFKSGTSRRS